MQKWQKDRNYRKYENEDGSVAYVITIDGEVMEVNEEVFMAYSQADRRERYCVERDAGRLLSLERMMEEGRFPVCLRDKHIESAEDTTLHELLLRQTCASYASLAPEERQLLDAVVLGDISEREYATMIGLSQKGVNKRKKKILKKLKNMVLTAWGYWEG